MLTFIDLLDTNKFINLQDKFILRDSTLRDVFRHYRMKSSNETIKINVEIFERKDTIYQPERYNVVEIDFYEDYLSIEISKLSYSYYKKFIDDYKDTPMSQEMRKDAVNIWLKKLTRQKTILDKVQHLPKKVKESINEQIEDIKTKLEEYFANPYPEIKYKIPFNLNSNGLAAFFWLLRKKNVIGEISDSDLARIIDNVTQYQRSTSGNYVAMSSTKYKFSKLNNGNAPTNFDSDLDGILHEDILNK